MNCEQLPALLDISFAMQIQSETDRISSKPKYLGNTCVLLTQFKGGSLERDALSSG